MASASSTKTVMLWQGLIAIAFALAITATEQQEPEQVAELLLFVEKSSIEKYIENGEVNSYGAAKKLFRREISYFLTEINKLLATIQGQNIKLGLRKMKILTKNIIDSQDGRVHSDELIKEFVRYLQDTQAFKTYKYDLALLFTGLDLHKSMPGTEDIAGYAYRGAICQEIAAGLVEFEGNYENIMTAAHEVGHILGSRHDPDGAGCIMAPSSNSGSDLRWQFTAESSANITETISGLTCMTETSSLTVIPAAKSAPRAMQDANSVCVRYKGRDAYFYRGKESMMHGDVICTEVQCCDGKSNNASIHASSEGMICGREKACHKGKCVVDPTSLSHIMNEKCLFGDQKKAHMYEGIMACSDVITQGLGGGCRLERVRAQCCQSCIQEETGDPSCLYGNVKSIESGGKKLTCEEIDQQGKLNCEDQSLASLCCDTCNAKKTGDPNCPYGDATVVHFKSGKLTCEEADQSGDLNCNDPPSASHCCATCNEKKTGDPGCPYGDVKLIKFSSGKVTCEQADQQGDLNCNDPALASHCCATCNEKKTGDPSCPYGDIKLIKFSSGKMTCEQADQQGDLNCHDPASASHCCATCNEKKTGDPSCPFGNTKAIHFNGKKMSCEEADQQGYLSCNDPASAKHCCATCGAKKTDDPSCPYGNVPFLNFAGGIKMTCEEADQKGQLDCSNPALKSRCCATCNARDPSCPLGETNRFLIGGNPMTCKELMDAYGYQNCQHEYFAEKCCKTCKGHTVKRRSVSGATK